MNNIKESKWIEDYMGVPIYRITRTDGSRFYKIEGGQEFNSITDAEDYIYSL